MRLMTLMRLFIPSRTLVLSRYRALAADRNRLRFGLEANHQGPGIHAGTLNGFETFPEQRQQISLLQGGGSLGLSSVGVVSNRI
jgi:hypothetical protein